MSEAVDKLFYDAHNDSASKDFEFARANIYSLIETQKASVDRLTELADHAQIARVYEVLGKFIETMVNTNEKLIELQIKVRALKDVSAQIAGPKTVNHNQTAIFVGTTAELQKHFKHVMKEEKDADGAIQTVQGLPGGKTS